MMHHARRKRLAAMPLSSLRSMHQELGTLIAELEGSPTREVDIASGYTGDAGIARRVDVRGDPSSRRWREVLQIYCSVERCSNYPHGDFIYQFVCQKGVGGIVVKYLGKRVFSTDTLDRLSRQARAPVALYTIDIPRR